MNYGKTAAVLAVSLCLTGKAWASAPETIKPGERGSPSDHRPDGKGIGTIPSHPGSTGTEKAAKPRPGGGNGIAYHGGPLIIGIPHLYYIWYGNWAGNTSISILDNLAAYIGGSPYYSINTTYYNGSGTHLTNAAALSGSSTDNYSQGKALSDTSVYNIVANAIKTAALPADADGVYFVLASADVTESSGFCSKYCGWHTYGAINGVDIKYAFIGDPDQCPSACEAQTVGPNGNPAADGMASIVAHEFEESASDPDQSAWYNSQGYENADLCAWKFGATRTLSSGAKYNQTFGTLNYLIQENWVNASGGYCAQHYP